MRKRLLRYLDIRPDEQGRFNMMFLQSFFMGFATSFFFVSATSHFVKTAGVQQLPLAYLISGFVGILLVGAYKRIQISKGIVFSYRCGLVLYAAMCVLLYVLYIQPHSQAMSVYLAYAGLTLIMPFTAIFAIGSAVVSLQVFNLSQSKRLLAMIGIGETIAAIIAYLLIPFVMKLIGDSVHLLPASALLMILALIPFSKLISKNADRFNRTGSVKKKAGNTGLSFLRKDHFFKAIMMFTFFSVLAIYLADYSYLIAVRYFSVQTEIETASIVAVIFSVLKTSELVFSFLSRSIQSKYGMKTSLLMLPGLLILFSVFALIGSLLHVDPLFMLFFLIINKINERVIRKAITTPSVKIVYQATEAAERARLQTTIEGTFSQIATIVAGAVLMLVSIPYAGKPADVQGLLNFITIICTVVYLGWLLSSMGVFTRYKQKINQFLFSHKPGAREKINTETDGAWQAFAKDISLEDAPAIDPQNREQVLSVIVHYNPSIKDYIHEWQKEPDVFFKRIVRSYFNNDNFFNRISIIWLAAFFERRHQFSFFRDVYQLSNQFQRLLLLRLLNKGSDRIAQGEIFYFISLVQETAREAIQLESVLEDLSTVENEAMQQELRLILKRQKNILLELLKIVYDPDAMSAIQTVINQTDSSDEHQQFAVELLSNILKPGVKEFVLPVFESVPFSMKSQMIASLFFVYELSPEERLRDIVMMDVKLVNPYVKQLAMQAYYDATGNDRLFHVFAKSNWENLREHASQKLLERTVKTEESPYTEFEKKLRSKVDFSYLSLFKRYGVGEEKKQFRDVSFGGNILKLDTTGLAIMFALSEKN